MTINEMFALTWNGQWKKQRYQDSRWGKEAKGLFLRHIRPAFGNLHAAELTSKQIRNWHEKMRETPFSANRSLDVLSRMYKFAWEQEALDCQNPCSRVKKFPERKRKRFATAEEISRLGKLLERERAKHTKQVAFLELMIYTGSRPKAIKDARWSDLEDHGSHMVLSVKGKTFEATGDMDTIVVPPQAVSALRGIGIRKGSGLIFGIDMPRRLWNRIREEAGCPDLWARDWRRTFASVGLSNKESLDVIGEALNHKSRQTTLRYAKLQDDKKVEAVSRIADQMESLLHCNN